MTKSSSSRYPRGWLLSCTPHSLAHQEAARRKAGRLARRCQHAARNNEGHDLGIGRGRRAVEGARRRRAACTGAPRIRREARRHPSRQRRRYFIVVMGVHRMFV